MSSGNTNAISHLITYKKYPITLEINDFLKDTMSSFTIPSSDIEKYGYPISAFFYNYSNAPGAVDRYSNDEYSFNIRSLSKEYSGYLQLVFLKI